MTGQPKRGRTRIGCLFQLLVLGVLGFLGIEVGGPYYRYLTFKDDMAQEASFARSRSESQIRARLLASADSLGLPLDGSGIRITRVGNSVAITAAYSEEVNLIIFRRELHFAPAVQRTY